MALVCFHPQYVYILSRNEKYGFLIEKKNASIPRKHSRHYSSLAGAFNTLYAALISIVRSVKLRHLSFCSSFDFSYPLYTSSDNEIVIEFVERPIKITCVKKDGKFEKKKKKNTHRNYVPSFAGVGYDVPVNGVGVAEHRVLLETHGTAHYVSQRGQSDLL